MHAGVAHNTHVNDVLPFNICRRSHLSDDTIQTIKNGLVKDLQAFWVGHSESDPGHDVFAVNHLRIHHGSRRHDSTIGQIAQITSHCRGAHINREAVNHFHRAWFDLNDFFTLPDRYGDLPISFPYSVLQVQEHLGIDG